MNGLPHRESAGRTVAARLDPGPKRLAAAVFLLSAGVIALELALMRSLLVARYHHFSYLVISTALLGFGVSGTVLTFVGQAWGRRFGRVMWLLALLFAVVIPVSMRAAGRLELDMRFLAYQPEQWLRLGAYPLLLLWPFVLAAGAIGLALMRAGPGIPGIYAANLAGSGAGAALAVGAMYLFPPARLVEAVSILPLGAAVILAGGRWRWRLATTCAAAAGLLMVQAAAPPRLGLDKRKALWRLGQLEAQGAARHLVTRFGPRARIDVYDDPQAHWVPFADTVQLPPPMLSLLLDGNRAGAILRIGSPDQAAILDDTPMAVAYALFEPRRVLLLGAIGTEAVWLARRHRAESIVVVQPNRQITELLRGPLAARGGSVLCGEDVRVVHRDPRAFVEQTDEKFDLIQIVSLESFAAGSAGVLALHENYLATREGFARCFERLTDAGVLTMTRGMQYPPRDNIKLFATAVEAVESCGIARPAEHVALVANYLAGCTLVSRRPWDAAGLRRLTAFCRRQRLRILYPQELPAGCEPGSSPSGPEYDALATAAAQIAGPDRQQYYQTWPYQVRPATDDRPYFYDFFRWHALIETLRQYATALRRAGQDRPSRWQVLRAFLERQGAHWFARAEWGYLVLVLAAAWSAGMAIVLVLLPVAWLRWRGRAGSGKAATGGYFLAIGAGFMFMEMAFIQKMSLLVGDPIIAVAVVLASFLLFSGLGSLVAGRLVRACPAEGSPASGARMPAADRWIALAVVAIVAVGLACTLVVDRLFAWTAGWPMAVKLLEAVALLVPLAFAMGMPFPLALRTVQQAQPALVAWSWAVNGFASVTATSLAVMVAMTLGFSRVVWIAAGLYAIAGVLGHLLPGRPSAGWADRPAAS